MDAEALLRRFFEAQGAKALPADRESFLAVRFLDQGLIDSLGIIALISEIESGCAIRFTADDLESYEFQSIGGLLGLIERHRKAGG